MTTEKLSQSSHVKQLLNEIKNNSSSTDVTLVSDDNTEFKAHKAILSSCSSVLHDVLEDVQLQDTVIYLKDIEHQEIQAMLDYIYFGETYCNFERKREFLKFAEVLQLADFSEGSFKLIDNEDPIPCNMSIKTNLEVKPKTTEYFCEFCDYKSKLKYSVKSHTQSIHENKRSYACDKCNYIAKRKDHVRTHIKTVHDIPKYVCDICNHKFSLPCSLKKHRLTHTGLKFPCNHCSQQFTQHYNLKLHIESIHNGLKYDCPQCAQQFTAKKNLSRHLRVQHFEVPIENKN